MIALWAVGSVLTVGGLRVDLPQDAAPVIYGADAELRYVALDDVTVGLALGWSAGSNDTNPNRKLITHRTEAQVVGGYRLGDEDYALHARIRFGFMYVYQWPRGSLSRLDTFGPVGGLELAGEIGLGPVWLEPHVGYETVRINQIAVSVPYFGLRLGGEIGRLFGGDGDDE